MRSAKTIGMLATAAIAGLCLVSQANAAAYTWVPTAPAGNDNRWDHHKNWTNVPDDNTVPSSSADSALFTGTAPTTVINVPAATIGSVTITGGSYNINGLITDNLTINGGGLSGGTYTVNADYGNAGWAGETGNTFDPNLNVSGATINAGGTNSLLVTLPDTSTISGGGSATLNFGTIGLGDTITITFQHTQATGLTLHEALQTPSFGGVMSILHGATPINDADGELMSLGTSGTETFTLVANSSGSVSGNLVFVSNFDNAELAPITITVSGLVDTPEPTSLGLLGVAGLLLMKRRPH